jgi:hypothetical protein
MAYLWTSNKVITNLYRIPTATRPGVAVFDHLAGLTSRIPQEWPKYLVDAVKKASPLRTAIKALVDPQSLEERKASAKAIGADVFDINFILAKAGILDTKRNLKARVK